MFTICSMHVDDDDHDDDELTFVEKRPADDAAAAPEAPRFGAEMAELVALGMDVARSLKRLAVAQADLAEMAAAAAREAMAAEDVVADEAAAPAPERPGAGLALAALQRLSGLGDMGMAFSRVSRAVRLTVALEARLKLGPEAFAPPGPRRGSAGAAGEAEAPKPVDKGRGDYIWEVGWRKAQLDLYVERAIEVCAPESEHRRLLADMCERIAEIDADEEFLERPIGDLLTQICRDLGLDPDPAIFNEPDHDPPDPIRSARPIRRMRGPGRPHWAPLAKHRPGFYPESIWAKVAPKILERRRETFAQEAAEAEAAVKAARMAEGP
jgi:hypothetical protein